MELEALSALAGRLANADPAMVRRQVREQAGRVVEVARRMGRIG